MITKEMPTLRFLNGKDIQNLLELNAELEQAQTPGDV